MSETKETLLDGLYYVQKMLAEMQSVLEEYIKLERAFRSKEAAIGTTSVKDRSKLLVLTVVGTLVAFNLFVQYISGGVAVGTLVLLIVAALIIWKKWKQKSKLKWVAVLIFAYYVYDIAYRLFLFMNIFIAILLVIVLAVVVGIEYTVITGKNRQIAAHNEQVEQHNADVQARREALYSRYSQLQKELDTNAPSWFPPDYYNMEAIEFFIGAVRNNRADSVKEMVNLFESTAQHQEMISYQRQQTQQLNQLIDGQQAIQGQLRFANMMSVANFIQTAAIGKDVRRAADAAGRSASNTSRIASELSRIREKL